MKYYQHLLFFLFSLMLSACASFSSNPHPGKLERVGVLLVKNCQPDSDCDQYSLLKQDMQTRLTILSGNIDASLKGQLIAVLGKELVEIDEVESLSVEKTKAITNFDYRPYISKAVFDYTQKNYNCASLWDQSYAWRLDNRQPILIATLSHPSDPDSGVVQLEFDGLNKALLSAASSPEEIDPCRLR